MQLLEVKNNIAKIVYNPAENHLLPSDFLLIEDFNQKLISQIINIETTDESNNNLAVLRLALSIDKEDNLSLYNGYIPAKSSKIIYINPDEIMELIKGNGLNMYFGNLANNISCFVKPSISFLNDNLYIQSDRDDKTYIVIQNIIRELQNKNKKVLLLDFDGRYNSIENSLCLKISQNFKLPLNIDAFNTILENDISDCPIEDKAVIQSIVLELREYLQTIPEKFIPFTRFKNVVDDEFLSNPVSGLMLFRNKLWLYSQDNIFAEDINQFKVFNKLFETANTIVIDASLIDAKWYKFIIQTLLNLINIPCYFILSLNDILLDRKSIINLYNKEEIIPVVSTSYENKYRQILKSICKNQILSKPSKIQTDDENYSLFLNRINTSEIILYGEATFFLPLIVELKLFTPTTADEIVDNEIKKDVDKLLSSSQSVISPENITNEISSTIENTQENYEIIEEDDLTDSDLDFLDEDLNQQSGNDDKNIISDNQEKYDLFEPIEVESQQDTEMTEITVHIDSDESKENLNNINDIPVEIVNPVIEKNENIEKNDIVDQIVVDNQIQNIDSINQNSDINTENKEELVQEYNEELEEKKLIITENDIITDSKEETSTVEQIEEENKLAVQEEKELNIEDNQIKEEEITSIDEVVQTITEKLNEEDKNKNIEDDKAEIKIELEEEEKEEKEEKEPPVINENINIKKSVDLPIYETDNSSSILIEDMPFKIGDKVYHPKHGKGVIEGFANYSNKILFCQIEFENVGRRILDPRISGIEKIS